ncbi:hypothetical protein MRBLRH8O_001475 [Agrobacterium radiobacter]|uniref:hypothetical protein n=1 Tax=Agrobacterium radiobacter TaxID=362 RepID=UPI00346601A1
MAATGGMRAKSGMIVSLCGGSGVGGAIKICVVISLTIGDLLLCVRIFGELTILRKKYRSSSINITNHYYASPMAAVADRKPKLADIANIATVAGFFYPILAFLAVSSLTLLPGDEVGSSSGRATPARNYPPTVKNEPINRSSPAFPFLKVEDPGRLYASGDDAPINILNSRKVSSVMFFSPSRKRHVPRCTPSYISKLEQYENAHYAAHGSGVTVTVTRRYFGIGGFDIITKRSGAVQSSFAEDQTFACWIGSPPPSTQRLPQDNK